MRDETWGRFAAALDAKAKKYFDLAEKHRFDSSAPYYHNAGLTHQETAEAARAAIAKKETP